MVASHLERSAASRTGCPHGVYRSASVTSAPAVNRDDPTAMQTLPGRQDTLARNVNFAPAGLGVGWIVQPTPVAAAALINHSANVADPAAVTALTRTRVPTVR